MYEVLRGQSVSPFLSLWLENLLRAVLLVLAMLVFLGWGFGGETGLVGQSLLIVVGAMLAVSMIPDSALRDPYFRICWASAPPTSPR